MSAVGVSLPLLGGRGPERLLTPREVADYLGASPSWVLDHATRRRPLLKSVKLGKLVRFRRPDVEEFIQECLRIQRGLA